MNRNWIYFILLCLLAAAVYYFVIRKNQSTFDQQEANFQVEEIDAIQRIELSDLQGHTILLEKKNSSWILNDSLEPVPQRVRDILEALEKQEPLQAANWASHDHVVRSMSSQHTKVNVYTDRGLVQSFYVAQFTAPNNLTYMLKEGAERPYIVKLPLQDLFIGLRYTTQINDWRSRRILYAKPEEIKQISIQYQDSSQYSFTITQSGPDQIQVSGNQIPQSPMNIKRAKSYLRLWDSIYCLGYENRNRIKDTIFTQGKRLAKVSIDYYNRKPQTLDLFFKPITKGTKATLELDGQLYDFDVFIGWLNQQEMIVVPRTFAQIMLRSFPEFFEKDTPVKDSSLYNRVN